MNSALDTPLESTSWASAASCWAQSQTIAQLCFCASHCAAVVSRNHTCALEWVCCKEKPLFCRAPSLKRWDRWQVERRGRHQQALWLAWPPVAVVRCHVQGLWQSWDSDPAVCVPMALAQLLDLSVSKVSGSETLPRVQQCSVAVNQNNTSVYQPWKNDQKLVYNL